MISQGPSWVRYNRKQKRRPGHTPEVCNLSITDRTVMVWLMQFRDDWVTATALACSRNSSNYAKNHGTVRKLAFWKNGCLMPLPPHNPQSRLGNKDGEWRKAVILLLGSWHFLLSTICTLHTSKTEHSCRLELRLRKFPFILFWN